MPIEELPELEDRLRRQPSWEPPPGFARRVALRASAASEYWPPVYGRRGRIVRAAAIGLSTAAAVYVIGSLISLTMPLVLQDASFAIDASTRLGELTTRLVMGRAVQVAWVSAVASLSFSASLVLRARA